MRKAVLLMAVFTLGMVTACGSTEQTMGEEEVRNIYEYEYRDVGTPVYRSAASSFSGGDGSEEAPYEISSAEELQYMAELFSDIENRDYLDKCYVLTADISLNDTSNYENWKNERPEYDWKPIRGVYSYFSGIFDGNGHTISGMYINADRGKEDDADTYGLFAQSYGVIKNLNMKDTYLEVSGCSVDAGTIVGKTFNAQILDCSVEGTAYAYDGNVGGIVGNAVCSTIDGCRFSGVVQAVKNVEGQCEIGGIAGRSNSNQVYGKETQEEHYEGVIRCVNQGQILATEEIKSASIVGGIVGSAHGEVTQCINEGSIQVKGEIQSGGIAGSCGVASNSGDAKITGCINRGAVTSTKAGENTATAGIVGWICNVDSRYEVVIRDCVNEGQVFCDDNFYAGIVADISCHCGENRCLIVGCENKADFLEGECAGIAYRLVLQSGEMVFSENMNHGDVSSSGLYGAGILAYVVGMCENWSLKLENCVNDGMISSEKVAGGIVGSTNYFTTDKEGTRTFEIVNCKNHGVISTASTNGFLGGILAGEGFQSTKAYITGCENTGNIEFTRSWEILEDDLTIEDENGETKAAPMFTLSVTAGGIVGRIGTNVFLSVDADSSDIEEINKEDAMVTISDCVNTGKLSYEIPKKGDDVTEEKMNEIVENYFKASMGGILGDCSCNDDYSVKFENCRYNTERGIGNTELPDIIQ